MIFEISYFLIFSAHIVPFLLYVIYMRHVSDNYPWNIKTDHEYLPCVSIIIPTYNEGLTIENKLHNIMNYKYPHSKMDVIIVDSSSTDGTVNKVKDFMKKNMDIKIKIIEEPERKSMISSINNGLSNAEHEIILKTDADCISEEEALRNSVKYLADPRVGSVAGLHKISAHKETMAVNVEKKYRSIYKWIRIGESKKHSTILYEGEFMLFKKRLIDKMGGFDENIGAGDIQLALMMAKQGYRAISVEDVKFNELTPYTWKERIQQKSRRGMHILQGLWKFKNLRNDGFRLILFMELYIYLINPLLFLLIILLSPLIILRYPLILIFFSALIFKSIRELFITHLSNELIMIKAIFNQFFMRNKSAWSQINQIR